MKKLLLILLATVSVASYAETKKDIADKLCRNTPVKLYFNDAVFAPSDAENDISESFFGTAAHRGITKSFTNDTTVLPLIVKSVKDACSLMERGVVMEGMPLEDDSHDGAIHAIVDCKVNSVTSTVEERRDGVSWGGVWASIKLKLTISDAFTGETYFSDVLVSEGRSNGGFNINLSGVEDAAERLSCFLGDDLRVLFPTYGAVTGTAALDSPSKTAFTVALGTDDNVRSGGLGTYRVVKIEQDGEKSRLVEIGAGYIFNVTSGHSSVFRITTGASAVKKAYEEGETLVIKSK